MATTHTMYVYLWVAVAVAAIAAIVWYNLPPRQSTDDYSMLTRVMERVTAASELASMTDLPWEAVARQLVFGPVGARAGVGVGSLAQDAYGTPLSARTAAVPLSALGGGGGGHGYGVRFGRGGKNEERCRQILEHWFGTPFPNTRPAFLKWKTGRNLELDMYSEQLKLAVEYDGIMHRRFHPSFHRTEADFLYQQAKDRWKDERCREVGVTLVRVPDTVHFDDLPVYLRDRLQAVGFDV